MMSRRSSRTRRACTRFWVNAIRRQRCILATTSMMRWRLGMRACRLWQSLHRESMGIENDRNAFTSWGRWRCCRARLTFAIGCLSSSRAKRNNFGRELSWAVAGRVRGTNCHAGDQTANSRFLICRTLDRHDLNKCSGASGANDADSSTRKGRTSSGCGGHWKGTGRCPGAEDKKFKQVLEIKKGRKDEAEETGG